MRDSVYLELGRELEKKEMAVPDFEADALTPERSLENYHLLPARGDLFKKLSRLDEARAEFERAFSSYRRILSISSVDPLLRESAVSHFI